MAVKRPGLGHETGFSLRLLAHGETGNRNESHHPQSRSRNLAWPDATFRDAVINGCAGP
nr:hypothetical protein [Escherichia coli]MDZ9220606.1 hypothetical protein [Escherichia coli]